MKIRIRLADGAAAVGVVILGVLGILIGYVLNIIKVLNIDTPLLQFNVVELLQLVGIVVPPIGVITGWVVW